MKPMNQILLVAFVLVLTVSCNSVRDVSFTVNSEPQGAYVTLEVIDSRGVPHPPTFMGHTPITEVSTIDLRQTQTANTVTLTAHKEGYFEQKKTWTGSRFVKEYRENGGIFWEPHMVRMNIPN